MKSIGNYIYEITFASDQKITEELLDYYEKNPAELDLIIEEEDFQLGFLMVFFIIGFLVMLATKSLQLFSQDQLPDFVTVVVLEILLEIGKALLGGTIVAYFIEFLRHKQFTHNKAFRAEIKRRIEERAKSSNQP
ncbi:MAG: hypothetical protein MRZ79_15270 [Bacteroidia bacterium]|nr:hypothetical protein [Bacteroidia bacterium]